MYVGHFSFYYLRGNMLPLLKRSIEIYMVPILISSFGNILLNLDCPYTTSYYRPKIKNFNENFLIILVDLRKINLNDKIFDKFSITLYDKKKNSIKKSIH